MTETCSQVVVQMSTVNLKHNVLLHILRSLVWLQKHWVLHVTSFHIFAASSLKLEAFCKSQDHFDDIINSGVPYNFIHDNSGIIFIMIKNMNVMIMEIVRLLGIMVLHSNNKFHLT